MEPLASVELTNRLPDYATTLDDVRDPAGNLVLKWGGEGWLLQGTSSIDAPWSDVQAATSPYRVDLHQGPARFHRLIQKE